MSDDHMEATARNSDEWEELFVRFGDRITEQLRFHVVAFDDGASELIGTGMLVGHRDRHYIFTVGHVVEDCRKPLQQGRLRLVTRNDVGQIVLDQYTELLLDYSHGKAPYRDAGIVCLTPADAAKIGGWTNNTWYELPRNLHYTEMFLQRPIDGRIFFSTGFAPYGPNALVRDYEKRRISYTYTVYAMHRAQQASFDGTFAFAVESEEWTSMYRDEAGNEAERVFPAHRLSGMSGSPVWTFDFDDNKVEVWQVGFHSASNATELITVPSSQHIELLLRSVPAAR